MAVNAHVCLPLCSLLQQPKRDGFTACQDRRTSSWEFVNRVAALSCALSNKLTVSIGSVVMIASLNTDYMLEALLAACDAGCVATPVNHRWSGAELANAIRLTQPACIMTDQHCSSLVYTAVASLHGDVKPVIVLLGPAADASHRMPCTAAPQSLSPQTDSDKQLDGNQQADMCHAASLMSQQCAKRDVQPRLQLLTPPSGAALICFTSGTTGQPKGVLLTHASIHFQSMAKLAVVGYAATDTYLHLAPLFHIGGLSSAFACIMAGACHVLLPRFTGTDAVQCINQLKVTTFIAVPAIMQDLVSHAEPMAGVRCILMGAGATPPALQKSITATFPCARVVSAYGMTEACSSITFMTLLEPHRNKQTPSIYAHTLIEARTNHQTPGAPAHTLALDMPASDAQPNDTRFSTPDDQPSNERADHHPGSTGRGGGEGGVWAGAVCVGRPAPGIAVRVAPVVTGGCKAQSVGQDQSIGHGQSVGHSQQALVEGEVWTKGPHTLHSYWRNKEETNKVYARDGWMRTGDIGFFDRDGALWLKGRAKDMIKTGGENVYAVEVEAALCRHPGVTAAAVVGVPHVRWGEMVAAVVALKSGWDWADGPVVNASQWQGGEAPIQERKDRLQERQGVADGNVLTSELLQAYCRQEAKLSPYKVPRLIASVSGGVLPTNASGKVTKPVIRDALIQALQTRDMTMIRSRL